MISEYGLVSYYNPQTFNVWMAVYDSKHLIEWLLRNFVKQILVEVLTVIVGVIATSWIDMYAISYWAWFILAIKVFVIWLLVVVWINGLLYRERLSRAAETICKKNKRSSKSL